MLKVCVKVKKNVCVSGYMKFKIGTVGPKEKNRCVYGLPTDPVL